MLPLPTTVKEFPGSSPCESTEVTVTIPDCLVKLNEVIAIPTEPKNICGLLLSVLCLYEADIPFLFSIDIVLADGTLTIL